MSISVRIPSILRRHTDSQEVVPVTGSNVKECLRELEAQYPAIREWVYDSQGEVLPHLQFYVNRRRVLASETDERLQDGDELVILIAYAGG